MGYGKAFTVCSAFKRRWCAVCKRVRDHEASWHPIEHYVLSQASAQITHEVCPECAVRLGETLDRR